MLVSVVVTEDLSVSVYFKCAPSVSDDVCIPDEVRDVRVLDNLLDSVERYCEKKARQQEDKAFRTAGTAITHPNKKWQFTPIFRNEGSCFLLKYRSEWKNGGNYYVIKSLDAGKDDYEPCIEKMKECSGKNVTYVNEGENCGKAEEGC
ncbi:hypothetical protein MRX96_024754 [Rhipicephalus microplus]